jgi:RsmE family RNA methyltransferase
VNLLLLDRSAVGHDGAARVTGRAAAHLLNVLKVAPGQTVRVGIVEGARGLGTVTLVEPDAVGLHCTFETAIPPRPAVDLLLALPRPKVLRRLWAQLAAIGVGQIILTNAERVERHYFDTHVLTGACYRPLLIEGLQQARDTRLPAVSVHRRFKVLVEDDLDVLFPVGRRLVAHPEGNAACGAVPSVLAGRALLAIGPEGGWNDFELQLLEAHGFQRVAIGRRTLRTDTACVALLALVHAALRPDGS